jgi:hypothetical protein
VKHADEVGKAETRAGDFKLVVVGGWWIVVVVGEFLYACLARCTVCNAVRRSHCTSTIKVAVGRADESCM